MAKRTRYPNRTTTRPAPKHTTSAAGSTTSDAIVRPIAPGPTPPDEAFGADDLPLRSSGHLTEAELDRAEALEAESTAREKAAIAASLRRQQQREQQPHVVEHGGVDVNAPLSVRAAKEYGYVARDVRRITITASFMLAILIVLHLLVNVFQVITL